MGAETCGERRSQRAESGANQCTSPKAECVSQS